MNSFREGQVKNGAKLNQFVCGAIGAVGIVLVVAVVLAPLLEADWHTDDWAWLATALQADAPLAGYVQNHGLGYYYRPAAIALWGVAVELAGTDPLPHYLQVLALHCVTIAVVGWCAARLGADWRRGLVAAVLFAVAPTITGTVSWLSSRNEALVLCFGVLAMALAMRPGGWRRAAGIGVCLWVAATARETGFAFFPAVALLFLREVGWRGMIAPRYVLPIALPLLLAFLPRFAIVIPIQQEGDPTKLPGILVQGMWLWSLRWPQALGGWGDSMSQWLPLGALALLLAGAGAWRLWRSGEKLVLAALLVVLALSAAAQSPIVTLVLVQPEAVGFDVNLRFFALPTTVLALIAAQALPLRSASFSLQAIAAAALFALVASWSWHSNVQASAWAKETQAQANAVRSAIEPLLLRRECPEDLQAGVMPIGLEGFADAAFKASLPIGDPRRACVIGVAGMPPHVAVLPKETCSAPRVRSDWRIPVSNGVPATVPFGGACQIAFRLPPEL